jgi:carbonic anhydrase
VKGACDKVQLGNLTGLLEKMEPAVAATSSSKGEDRSSKNDAFVDRVAETNVRQTMANIRRHSPILRQMEKEGQIRIVGGIYDIETGKVTFFK